MKWASIGIITLFVGVFVLFNAAFVVSQTNQALILEFGKPVRVVKDPGLKFKIPFIQNVEYYDKRLIDFDGEPKEVIAADQKRLMGIAVERVFACRASASTARFRCTCALWARCHSICCLILAFFCFFVANHECATPRETILRRALAGAAFLLALGMGENPRAPLPEMISATLRPVATFRFWSSDPNSLTSFSPTRAPFFAAERSFRWVPLPNPCPCSAPFRTAA